VTALSLPVPSRLQAILLDRDGTINVERADYVLEPGQLQLLPGAVQAMARIARWGIPVLVVTNQSGVGRGLLSEEMLLAIHTRLREELAPDGGRIDDFFVCPHHPNAGCSCRKPRPGLLVQAAVRYGLDLSQCLMIGDSATDLQAAQAAGCPALFVQSGLGRSVPGTECTLSAWPPNLTAADLAEAVELLECAKAGDAAEAPVSINAGVGARRVV
jgi:D-glycero-D-manno-heptose 1,7-bisphosphate phosphatase